MYGYGVNLLCMAIDIYRWFFGMYPLAASVPVTNDTLPF